MTEKNGGWLGPGKIMFQDKKAVFLDYGLSFMWVSSNRLPSNPP